MDDISYGKVVAMNRLADILEANLFAFTLLMTVGSDG